MPRARVHTFSREFLGEPRVPFEVEGILRLRDASHSAKRRLRTNSDGNNQEECCSWRRFRESSHAFAYFHDT